MIAAWRARRKARAVERDTNDDREILHILRTRGPAHAWDIRKDAGFRSRRVHRALDRLIANGLVKDHWDTIPGSPHPLRMYRATGPTTETTP